MQITTLSLFASLLVVSTSARLQPLNAGHSQAAARLAQRDDSSDHKAATLAALSAGVKSAALQQAGDIMAAFIHLSDAKASADSKANPTPIYSADSSQATPATYNAPPPAVVNVVAIKDNSPPAQKVVVPSPPAKGAGLFGFVSNNCGPSGATDEFPNGAQWFLNCGLTSSDTSSGWTPPQGITMDQLKVSTIEDALSSNPHTWGACAQFTWLFEKHGWANGIPPIMLASIALQESSCNQWAMGDNGGAHGLMQITSDKCGGAPSAGCSDPDYNIGTAAKFLKQTIDSNGGNIVQALGQYNGWFPGMSINAATAAGYGHCCVCQNNLDYIHQLFNGWLLGKAGNELGSYKNLAKCGPLTYKL